MFDFGFWELTIVLVVVLLVVGPEKMPLLAAKAGRWIGKAKRMVQSVRSDIESEIKAAELQDMLHKQQNEISELRSMLTDTKSTVEHEIGQITENSIADDSDHEDVSTELGLDENSSKPEQSV